MCLLTSTDGVIATNPSYTNVIQDNLFKNFHSLDEIINEQHFIFGIRILYMNKNILLTVLVFLYPFGEGNYVSLLRSSI